MIPLSHYLVLSAVLFALSALYFAATGVPYFIDSEIPAAVFLGLHLLVTDPSTSPKTPLGKSVFGVLYGLGVFGLYALLQAVGAPTFYDKLLCMPLLNLAVRQIDAFVGSVREIPAVSRWRVDWASARTNLAYMTVWIVLFGTMTAIGKTDGRHTGDSLPFWEQACAAGRRNACERLLSIEAAYCGDNSGWACNELGVHYTEGAIEEPRTGSGVGWRLPAALSLGRWSGHRGIESDGGSASAVDDVVEHGVDALGEDEVRQYSDTERTFAHGLQVSC